jgi:hypothetical protein
MPIEPMDEDYADFLLLDTHSLKRGACSCLLDLWICGTVDFGEPKPLNLKFLHISGYRAMSKAHNVKRSPYLAVNLNLEVVKRQITLKNSEGNLS